MPDLQDKKLVAEAETLWRRVQAFRSKSKYWVRVMKHNDIHYPWSLHECALMVRDGLRELGYVAYFDDEKVGTDYGWPTPEERAEQEDCEQQIIIGGNIASAKALATIPDSAIVYNFEQVGGHQFAPPYLGLLRRCTVWEYHPANIQRLKYYFNITATFVPFGYVDAFAPKPHKPVAPDYDVMFYGSMNPPRMKVVAALRTAGLRVLAAEGCYGADREDKMHRSKMILNVHYYQRVKVMEVVRLGIAMAAGKTVVTQLDKDTIVDPYYLPGIAGAPYDELVPTIVKLAKDDRARERIALKGLELFTARRAADSLQKGLDLYVPRQPASPPKSYERPRNDASVTYRRIPRTGQIW